ncbi:hypothetical protein Vretimale_3206 [Volvox reticuliferus]|uniref:Uncharacterized protein n=1 Tax=Volvox reticuliferus TaxID=1737510 RepID=A0A8J4DD11_9CHLO|nr:hypothetical protein Vretifemale_6665 [Volvox reticuliferus]GIL97578.1 hypothetical protein Vretimale_3206 [Volvox reticuliferus]
MARTRESWFEYLLRNKAIRTFLNNYAEQDWHEASKLTLIYGIINLGFLDGKAIVPLERLRDIVANSAKAVTVQKAIPSLNDQLEGLRTQLDDVVLDIQKGEREQSTKLHIPHRDAVEAVPDVPVLPSGQASDQQRADLAAANVSLRHAEKWLRYKGQGLAIDPQDMPAKVLDRAAAAEVAQRALSPSGLPPSEWRTGDRSRTYSPPGKKRSPVLPGDGFQGAEYPSWWGDGEDWRSGNSSSGGGGGAGAPGSPGRDGARARSAPRPGRRPPRLAYSVQLEPQASHGQPIWRNDLVTSRYLDVPSSGYARASSPPRVPQQYMPPPPLPQPSYGGAPGPYPMGGVPNVQPGMSGPFQAPYGSENPYGNGGPGPQLYVVQPTGAVGPVNAPAAAAAMWGPPPQQVHQPADQRHQQQQQQGGVTDRPAWKPIRTAKITSRIREQVQADRLAARARREGRQRALETAVAPSRLRPQQQQEGAWSPSASLKSPSGPSLVADSLASNPFTAWFITPPQAQRQDPQQQVQMQRPTTPTSQQHGLHPPIPQQVPWAETQYAGAEPQHGPDQRELSAPGTEGATSSSFQSWPTTPRHGPPSGPAASAGGMAAPPANASLTFYPRVPTAGIPAGSQLQTGVAYPAVTSATASAAYNSYNPYGGRQYGDPGLNQTRRVAWADTPQTQPPGASSWLSSPTAWEGPWQRNQQQQSPQPLPNQPPRPLAGQWLAGQPAAWPAVATGNTIAAGAGYGWNGQTGWLGAGSVPGILMAQPAQTSPRAEALKEVRPEVVKWSKSWVGDFGHLDGKRFPPSGPANCGAGRTPAIADENKAGGSSDGSGLAAAGTATSCPPAASGGGQSDKGRSADASGGGALGGASSASGEGASNSGAVSGDARPAEPPWRYSTPEHLQGLAPALAAADALLVAAALSNDGRGLRGGESAAVAKAASGQGSQYRGSLGGPLPGERAWDVAVKTAGSDRAGSGGSGLGAAAVNAQERAWNRVLGQVSRLGNMSELEINSSMRPSAEEEDVAEQQRRPAIALGTGGVKWDFDKIIGSPKGLTYQ